MIDRTARLRWRRRLKRHKRQVEDIGQQADEKLERHFFKRLERLYEVRRFIVTWVLLILLLCTGVIFQTLRLSHYYQTLQPVPGGVYTEGILGTFTNANPLYATNSVDTSVAKLLFSGLLTYNQNNQLTTDLAQGWSADERGATYTIHLKPNLVWQDGKPITADDVVFTYQTIQNPDADSPLINSWRGVNVSAPDALTIVFSLPNALTAFPYSLTNGIVPKHLLSGIPAAQLRSINFNTIGPVGSGPFKWDAIEVQGDNPENREERIGLTPSSSYHQGQPKLGKFIIRAFHDQKHLIEAFKNEELNGVSGLTTIPAELAKDKSVYSYDIPFTGEVLVFFKTTQELLQDVQVRRALIESIDTNSIIAGLGYPVIIAHQPLLKKQIGYDRSLAQASYNLDDARSLLDAAGWQVSASGLRYKGDRSLSFKIYAQDTDEYKLVTQMLKSQWQQVGVEVEVVLEPEADFQATVSGHNFDMLLSGIAIGNDPDVFAYWHSSQADILQPNHLNLSEYKSAIADQALEAGRSRADASVRAVKYRPFLEAWRNDAPAMALYQPRFLYLTRNKLFGFNPGSINSATDRFNNVSNWMIRQRRMSQ